MSDVDELYEQLVGMGAHRPGEEAALAVLYAHGYWLAQPDFVARCVETAAGQAWVTWWLVRRYVETAPGTALDREVLRLAVELATSNDRRRLDESVAFDGQLRAALVTAIARAGER